MVLNGGIGNNLFSMKSVLKDSHTVEIISHWEMT